MPAPRRTTQRRMGSATSRPSRKYKVGDIARGRIGGVKKTVFRKSEAKRAGAVRTSPPATARPTSRLGKQKTAFRKAERRRRR
jgi:hypothetical protein